jgi:hypothetical protein
VIRHFGSGAHRIAAAFAAILLTGSATAQAPPPTVAPAPVAAQSPALEDIRDIRGPRPIASLWTLSILCAGGALILAGAYAGWRWKRRRLAAALLPFEVALRRLEHARRLMPLGAGGQFSVEVSDTVRKYIETRFLIEAAHRTTEEFLRDQLATANTQLAAHGALLKRFLMLCDLAKFAGWNLAAEQMQDMYQNARTFVLDTSKSEPATRNGVTQSTSDKDMYVSLPST